MDLIVQPVSPSACPQCGFAVKDAENPFCQNCDFDLRYGQPKKPVKGKCIYCEETRELTDEHVFGKWLIAEFGRVAQRRMHRLGRPARHTVNDNEYHTKEAKPTAGDLFDLTVRNVCKECNTGWMSGVHTAAKPLVLHLGHGGSRVLTSAEKLALARWIVMVSINLECHGRIIKTTQHQRTALMDGKMPGGWRVGFESLTERRRDSHFETLVFPVELGAGNLYVSRASFSVEWATFHSYSSLAAETLGLAFLSGDISKNLPTAPLWPSDENKLPSDDS